MTAKFGRELELTDLKSVGRPLAVRSDRQEDEVSLSHLESRGSINDGGSLAHDAARLDDANLGAGEGRALEDVFTVELRRRNDCSPRRQLGMRLDRGGNHDGVGPADQIAIARHNVDDGL